MKTNNLSLYLLVLATGLTLTFGSCSKESNPLEETNAVKSELKNGNNPSASGNGQFLVGEELRHFSFHAMTKPNGTVDGNGVINYNGNGNPHVRFSIDCLNVEENVATLSGTVTDSNVETLPAGTPVTFRVVDNGEGSGSDADQMTLMYASSFYNCQFFPAFSLFPISGGNIQVNP